MDLQQQMDVIWHNYKMIHRNCRVIFGNIFDALPRNHAQICQGNIVRAIDDRPYIHPEQVFSIFRADGNKIGVGCGVIIFFQAVWFSLWQFHGYHLLYIHWNHHSKGYLSFQERIYAPPPKAVNGRPCIQTILYKRGIRPVDCGIRVSWEAVYEYCK